MSDEEPTESLDFLLRPELIQKFKEMFEVRINALENEIEKIDQAKQNCEKARNNLKEKLEILTNYSKFIELKGFGHIKQSTDEFFKEMEKATKHRLSENEGFECDETMTVGQFVFKYSRPSFHNGTCQFTKLMENMAS